MSDAARWSSGCAFYSPRQAPDGGHLWGVFSEPIDGQVLIANVTTLRRDSDRSCILQPGDHPRIRHESHINYADSRFVAVQQLDSLPGIRVVEPFSPAVVQRVFHGALRSEDSPGKVKLLVRKLLARRQPPSEGGQVREAAAYAYG
jgi:hypothetical protein